MAGDRKFYMAKGSTYIEQQKNYIKGNQVFGSKDKLQGAPEEDNFDEKEFEQLEEMEKSIPQTNTPSLGAASLRPYLDHLLKFIKNARCWYGVAKAMMEKGYVAEGDFDGFCTLINMEYDEGELAKKQIPDARDLKSMYARSVRKNILDWDKNDQDLGATFDYQKTTAITALRILPNIQSK